MPEDSVQPAETPAYTGKKRGRKPGSKNKAALAEGAPSAEAEEKPAYTGKKRGRKPGWRKVKDTQPEVQPVKRGRGRPRKNPVV